MWSYFLSSGRTPALLMRYYLQLTLIEAIFEDWDRLKASFLEMYVSSPFLIDTAGGLLLQYLRDTIWHAASADKSLPQRRGALPRVTPPFHAHADYTLFIGVEGAILLGEDIYAPTILEPTISCIWDARCATFRAWFLGHVPQGISLNWGGQERMAFLAIYAYFKIGWWFEYRYRKYFCGFSSASRPRMPPPFFRWWRVGFYLPVSHYHGECSHGRAIDKDDARYWYARALIYWYIQALPLFAE